MTPKPFFSKLGTETLSQLLQRHPLLAFDFDGTLAPILGDYKKVRMDSKTSKVLRELSTITTVAVISGRALHDLKKLVKIPRVILIGNHGLEGVEKHKRYREMSNWINLFRNDLSRYPDVIVEDKIYSISIHYRNCKNKAEIVKQIRSTLKKLKGSFRPIWGKSVLNLLPGTKVNKGTAILKLMKIKKKHCAFYVGDDLTDEDVFSRSSKNLITLRVGKTNKTSAQFFVSSQLKVFHVLKILRKLACELQ